ncbi:alpha/beta fold hydrolase [Alkalimarinus coralli]|uniref:alpha/beta fold hydrolase n=1 Tax=Alkalimarinus coralli TaxID=2935863 RepID=UPI00202ADFE0|nr:alpha/beta fold hydrolase [Alkalimarinus coralli]
MNIVIINGWGMPSGIWAGFCDLLNAHIAYKRCKVIDIDRTLSVSEWVDYLNDIVEPDTLLVGWSLGGMLALEYAYQHPQNIRGVCLMQVNPKFVAGPDWSTAMDYGVFQAFKGLAGSENEADIKRLISRFSFLVTAGGVDALGDLKALKKCFSVDSVPTAKVLYQSLELLESLDVRNRLKDLKVPLLHLFGEQDQLVPVDVACQVDSALQRSELVCKGRHFSRRVELIPEMSHFPCVSAADLVVKQIVRFIGETV